MSDKHWSEKDDDDLTAEDIDAMIKSGTRVRVNTVSRWRSADGVCELSTVPGVVADAPTWLGQPMIAVC